MTYLLNVCILTGGWGGGTLTRPILLSPLSYFSIATGLQLCTKGYLYYAFIVPE